MDKVFQIKFYKYNLLKWECKQHVYYVEASSVEAIKKHRVFRWILHKEITEVPRDRCFDVKDSIHSADSLLDETIIKKYIKMFFNKDDSKDSKDFALYIKTQLFIAGYFQDNLHLNDNDKIYFFWDSVEGNEKYGIEETSGCILTESGLIDSFWLKYDDVKGWHIESAQLYGGSISLPRPYRVKNIVEISSLADCQR